MVMHVVVQQRVKHGANGDRATKHTQYYDYVVVIRRDEQPDKRGHNFTAYEFSGYDSFNSHILPDRYAEAERYAIDLAIFLGYPLEKMETYEWKPPVEVRSEWVRVS